MAHRRKDRSKRGSPEISHHNILQQMHRVKTEARPNEARIAHRDASTPPPSPKSPPFASWFQVYLRRPALHSRAIEPNDTCADVPHGPLCTDATSLRPIPDTCQGIVVVPRKITRSHCTRAAAQYYPACVFHCRGLFSTHDKHKKQSSENPPLSWSMLLVTIIGLRPDSG